MPRGKTISDNNIWQGTISTKDLRICLIQLHKLRAPQPFSNYAKREINIGILLVLLIYAVLFFLNQPQRHQKSFIHVVAVKLLPILVFAHLMLLVLHFLSLFSPSSTYWSALNQLERLHLSLLFEILYLLYRCSLA